MKKIYLLMTAALTVGAMVSCSDDLGLESQKVTKGGLTATIDSPVDRMATRLGVQQDGGVQGGNKTVVFGNNEQLRVFTLNQLQQDLYQINPGQGGNSTADFHQVVNNDLSGQLYAVTEASSVYGISAFQEGTEEAKPLLTLTLPGHYTSEADNAGLKNFPIPFWGPATVNGGNEFSTEKTLSAKLTGLTAILRVSANYLPKGTKAIVLTTHGRRDLMQDAMGNNKEGFQIVTPEDKAEIGGFNDLNSWWEDNVPYTLGGKSEPISGTLNTILDKDDMDNTYLRVDEGGNNDAPGMHWGNADETIPAASRLVTSDTLRVNLPFTVGSANQPANQVFYIPIVVGQYENLRVLAVTSDSKYTYRWIGYELHNFIDQKFERNKPYYLDMNLVELGDASISKLNWAIDYYNKVAGRTTVIEVDSLYKAADNGVTTYTFNQIEIAGAGNVVLNLKAIGKNDNYATSRDLALKFVNKDGSAKTSSVAPIHTVEINVPKAWDADGNGQVDPEADYMKVLLGNADVILGNTDKGNGETAICEVLASNTQYVSGHNFNRETLDIYDDKDAALEVVNGFKEIDFLEGNSGDIFVYNAADNEEELEISDILDIQTKIDINIRLTDAMVKKIKFVDGAVDIRYIYTTGSSAIGALVNKFGLEYKDPNLDEFTTVNLADQISADAVNADQVDAGVTMVTENTHNGAPNKVLIQAYWTGKALSYTAIQKGYDVSHIYTAAQLASVGAGWEPVVKFNPYTEQEVTFGQDVAPYTAKYVIPKDVIDFIWLGDDYTDSKGRSWRWIGSEVTVNGFWLHGENTRLVNMWLLTDLVGDKYWSDDPHICCTSCIGLPYTEVPAIEITENLGLIRSIINEDEATVRWINLNDVMYCNHNARIDNVGAVTGYIESPVVKLEYNYVGEIKEDANTENLGGLVGKIVAETSLDMNHNEVAGHSNTSGDIQSKQNYVGGHVGYIYTGTALYNDNRTDVENIYGEKNFVGGQVGYFESPGDVTADGNITVITENIIAEGSYAAGHIGQLLVGAETRAEGQEDPASLEANGNTTWVKQSIVAGGNYAGGHMGELLAQGDVVQNNNNIKVDDKINTGGKYVAGLNGHSEGQATYTANNNVVTVGYIQADGVSANASYAGGLYGHLWANNQIELLNDKVTAKAITGISGFVGGFAGRIWEQVDDVLVNDAEVTVSEKIQGTRYISGMFGDSECYTQNQNFYVHDADVTVELIYGSHANVGGIHGRVCTGIFYIGYNDPTGAYERDYLVRVNVGKMAGGYAVGGLVGENQSTSHRSPLYVKDGPSTTFNGINRKFYTQVIVNVGDWAITKTASFFDSDSQRNYLGTFGNILGLMHGDLFVDEHWDLAPQAGQLTKATRFTDAGKTMQTYLIVYDNLTSAKKIELLFPMHNDQFHNVVWDNNGEPMPLEQYYWGDGNGYLGWNATQQYYIDDVIQRGEQLDMGPFRWGHNCFLKYVDDASADAGYDAQSYQGAITKLQFYN